MIINMCKRGIKNSKNGQLCKLKPNQNLFYILMKAKLSRTRDETPTTPTTTIQTINPSKTNGKSDCRTDISNHFLSIRIIRLR